MFGRCVSSRLFGAMRTPIDAGPRRAGLMTRGQSVDNASNARAVPIVQNVIASSVDRNDESLSRAAVTNRNGASFSRVDKTPTIFSPLPLTSATLLETTRLSDALAELNICKPNGVNRGITTPPSETPSAPIQSPLPVTAIITEAPIDRPNAPVGDDPNALVVEIREDPSVIVVEKLAVRMLQIRRTKMNRHKLLKRRKKNKHTIRMKIAAKEKKAKKRMDDAVGAIHAKAHEFNPVDKVRRNIDLAKRMGYNVQYYRELPLNRWLDAKTRQAKKQDVKFKFKYRYRKVPPWETEKF